jgi:hypothetical protein
LAKINDTYAKTEVNTEGKRHCKENVNCCPKIAKNQQAKTTEMTMLRSSASEGAMVRERVCVAA